MRKSDLFTHKKIKEIRENTNLTYKQKEASRKWLSYLDAGDLEDEKPNYMKFGRVVLEDILGFPMVKVGHEKDNVDFSFNNSAGKKVLCIECKGTGTELDELQHRDKKAHETPIDQTWDYVSKTGSDYGICTNYKEFVLMTRTDYPALHWFDFESLRENPENLKEFVGIFSKERLIDNGGSVEVLHKESVNEEEEFTLEFYKLFHQTRLMMIRAFQEKEGVTKDEAIRYVQLYLNRLIFIFFAEDNKLLEKKIFMERVVKSLNSNVTEYSKMISDQILELFKVMDKGSDRLGIVGFDGELFQEQIPSKIHFLDLRDEKFFSDITSKIKSKIKPNNAIQSLIDKERKLNPIIKNLLMMDSFDFTTDLNVNILGRIFERSISDLEELKEDKASKRKKEGVYYTPEYITDYICRNTIIPYLSKSGANSVRELIGEYIRNIEELEKKFREIKIIDPACGSGAFLIKAIDILLEIHIKIQDVKEFEGKYSDNGQFQLTKWNEESEAKEIIENNIYGVDINPESVAITKLALFLKIAERGKKLSELTRNIKVGNSLISDKSIDKMAFNWELEFPQIFYDENGNKKNNNGFDIVIGNPPYVSAKLMSASGMDNQKSFFKTEYISAFGIFDLYVVFVEKGIKLLKTEGEFSFIIPNKFMINDYGYNLRNFLINTTQLREILDVSKENIFEGVSVYPIIITLTKPSEIPISYNLRGVVGLKNKLSENLIPIELFKKLPNNIFVVNFTDAEFVILKKILKLGKPLKQFCKLHSGTTGFAAAKTSKCIIDGKTSQKNVDFVVTGNIDRYKITLGNVRFMKKDYKKPKLILKKHKITEGKISLFKSNKIVIGGMTKRIEAAFDNIGLGIGVSVYAATDFKTNQYYILGLLNSKLFTFYYILINQAKHLAGDYLAINKGQLESIPIRPMEKTYEKKFPSKISQLCEHYYEKSEKDKLLTLIDGFLDKKMSHVVDNILLNIIEKRNNPNLSGEHRELSDKLIDDIIYKLYHLSDNEINIIEKTVSHI